MGGGQTDGKTRSVFWSFPCLVLKYLEFPRHQLYPCSSVKINGSQPPVMLREGLSFSSCLHQEGQWKMGRQSYSARTRQPEGLRSESLASALTLHGQRQVNSRKPSWQVYNGSSSVMDQLLLYAVPHPLLCLLVS